MHNVSIGFYAHHHGRGHLTRALQIAPHLQGRMALFSSTAPDDAEAADVDFHLLHADTEPGPRTIDAIPIRCRFYITHRLSRRASLAG